MRTEIDSPLLFGLGALDPRYRHRGSPSPSRARRGDDNVEIEFITDAPGAEAGVVEVQDGLTAQELRHVRLLLENTWTIDLARLLDGGDREVRVPTPGAFILHKGLVYRKRTDQLKKEKDLYYIFYVVDTFVEWHDWVRADLSALASRWPSWFKRCVANLSVAFAASDSSKT